MGVLHFILFLITLSSGKHDIRVISFVFTQLSGIVLLITWVRFPIICYFEMINTWETPSFRYLLEALDKISLKEKVLFISIFLCTSIWLMNILIRIMK